jgi:hypothetical protein
MPSMLACPAIGRTNFPTRLARSVRSKYPAIHSFHRFIHSRSTPAPCRNSVFLRISGVAVDNFVGRDALLNRV